MIRLNKYLAEAGVCSRRKADVLIASGAVSVNGVAVTEMGHKVSESDAVTVDGAAVMPAGKLEYYLLYKPTGVVSTCDDPQGRKTVLDIIETAARLYPVGRLDYESDGLLLLSNDGDFTHRVTHPSFEIEKEYTVRMRGELSEADINKLRTGVYIDGKRTHPAEVDVIKKTGKTTELKMVIHEGRNRQIRKMLRAVDGHVDALTRVRLGRLTLAGLAVGEYRSLTAEEIDYLKGLGPA